MLAGTYGPWLVEIEVQGMSTAQRTQIASLFAAHENPAGFLVLDPAAPMHTGAGPGSDIVLNDVDISDLHNRHCSSPGTTITQPAGTGAQRCDAAARVEVIEGDGLLHRVIDQVHVQRIGP